MTHKDVIFFSTLAVWVVFIFVIIVGGRPSVSNMPTHFCSVANWYSFSS
jgi:hypothetical protein